MTLSEKLMQDFDQLSEDKKKEVINYIEFLEMKERIELMDSVIDENEEALKYLANKVY